MRKILLVTLLVAAVFVSILPVYAAGAVDAAYVKIIINGETRTYSDMPIESGGRVLLPLRALLVDLGVPNDNEHILWDSKEQSVTVVKDGSTVYLKVGNSKAATNGTEVILDTPPVLHSNGRTYIPVRFVSQALGKKVAWDPATNTVFIRDTGEYAEIEALLEKCIQAHALIKKAEIDTAAQLSLTKAGTGMNSVVNMTAACDRTNGKISLTLKMPILSAEMVFKTYYADNTRYEYNPLKNTWSQYDMTDKEFSSAIEENMNPLELVNRELMCTGLIRTEDEENGEIVLSGKIFPDGLAKLITKNPNLGTYDIDNSTVSIYIDGSSYTVKKAVMDIDGKVAGTTGTSVMKAHIESVYKTLDEAYIVSPPEGLGVE